MVCICLHLRGNRTPGSRVATGCKSLVAQARYCSSFQLKHISREDHAPSRSSQQWRPKEKTRNCYSAHNFAWSTYNMFNHMISYFVCSKFLEELCYCNVHSALPFYKCLSLPYIKEGFKLKMEQLQTIYNIEMTATY